MLIVSMVAFFTNSNASRSSPNLTPIPNLQVDSEHRRKYARTSFFEYPRCSDKDRLLQTDCAPHYCPHM